MGSVWLPRVVPFILCTSTKWVVMIYMPDNIQGVLIFSAKLKIKERATFSITLSSWRTTATVSTGRHARWATGLTLAEREESFTRTESVATWSYEGRAAYKATRDTLLFYFFRFFFLTGVGNKCRLYGVPIRTAENNYTRGDGDLFSFLISGFCFISYSVLLCCAVLCCVSSFFPKYECGHIL